MKRAAALNRVRTSVLMTLMRTAADVWYHMGKSLLCIFSVRRVSVCLRVRFPLNPIPDLILPSPALALRPRVLPTALTC